MDLFIPTAGRWDQQPTLIALRESGFSPILVVQDDQQDLYARWDSQMISLPPWIKTIAPTRQWILDRLASEKFCMLDDDLVFYRRRTDDPTKLTDALPDDLERAFDQMDKALSDSHPHVGFAAREGANRNTHTLVENTRIMRVLGYNRDVLHDEGIRFDRMQVMEDFDVALQLLEKGYPNLVLNAYAHNQAGSGRAGGCAAFRTPSMQAVNANELARLHPGVVRVVQKTTKSAWGGGTRTDVNIQWKKAYENGTR